MPLKLILAMVAAAIGVLYAFRRRARLARKTQQ
jgi:hypothetical protein